MQGASTMMHTAEMSQTDAHRRPARPTGAPRKRWREAVASLLPRPEAQDIADIVMRRSFVEVAVTRGPLNRG